MSSHRDNRSHYASHQTKRHRSERGESEDDGYRKSKKDKRHKKSGHKRKRSESDSEDSQCKLPKGVNLISEDDYFSKSTEFRIWLRESKDKFFDELSSERTRRYFKKFVIAWNKCKLDKKFYEGMRSSQLTSSETTRYKWKNLKINQDELDAVKNSVDKQTNVRFASEVRMRSSGGTQDNLPRRIIGPSIPSHSVQGHDEDMDEEDKKRYEGALHKQKRKEFQKTRETVLEELAPKATGRDAMIEKKKVRNEYYRKEASPDIELNDGDLMGVDDYDSRLSSHNRARDAREQKRQVYKAEKAAMLQEKAVAYQSKEQETMEMFRKMAEQQRKSGGGLWGQNT